MLPRSLEFTTPSSRPVPWKLKVLVPAPPIRFSMPVAMTKFGPQSPDALMKLSNSLVTASLRAITRLTPTESGIGWPNAAMAFCQ